MLHTDTVVMMTDLQKRFSHIAELVGEAGLLLDEKSTVLAANQKALDLLGGHITGYPLDRFLRHPDFAEAVRRAVEEDRLSEMEYTRMDQMRRNFTLRFAPFDDGHVFLMIFDATMMQSVDRIRSDFVANVSHELRSPLTALTGFIETLQDGAVDDHEARGHFLTIMQTEAQRMQRLIDDLLSLSRVEAEEHRPPAEKVDIRLVLEETMSVMNAAAALNGQEFVFTLDADMQGEDLNVIGQADELRQVFQNLTENAIRYGHKDTPVLVQIDAGRTAGGHIQDDLLRVQVINHGDTIAPEHIGRLTERFYRIDKGRSRNMGGTGLGLAIVKHIINRHRGRLRVRSENEKVTVSVTLRRYL
jgi:two-component system, OmpR family, phosphate regulon sensor histidine kinase PhoR